MMQPIIVKRSVWLALVLVVAAYTSRVAGHGRMQVPAARQVIAWQKNQFYNPNGGNGAQTGSVGEFT